MAQLRVNREKVMYKVIVVGHVAVAADLKHCREDNNPLAVEVYDLEMKGPRENLLAVCHAIILNSQRKSQNYPNLE